ncbi:hypothetical protein [Aureivirga marina]|uniref:hypothetical protein n=1 Tax=Aureivirga marina TaxID=1182451 RepID=UPI0018C98DE1|nr:hypothetical protein [Aureivirga marina]
MKNTLKFLAFLCIVFTLQSFEKERKHIYFFCEEHQEEHNIFLQDGRLFHDWGRWEKPDGNWKGCEEHQEKHIRILKDGRVFHDIGKDEIDPEDI